MDRRDFEEEERELERQENRRKAGFCALVLALLIVEALWTNKEALKKYMPDLPNFKPKTSQESDQDITFEEEQKDIEANDYNDMEIVGEKERIQKDVTYDSNEQRGLTEGERAAIIANFYEKTGAYYLKYVPDQYEAYTDEDISRYIEVMNGEYKCDDESVVDAQIDELYSFYLAVLNSDKYKGKYNAYCRAQSGEDNSILPVWKYSLDLTDTVLPSQDYNAFVVVDYLDDLHKRILSSVSKEEAMNLTYSYYQCLASLLYGKGFDINGESYTMEDLDGVENLGLRSVLELATLEVSPYSVYIKQVPYIDKNGNVAFVDSQTITNSFTSSSDGTFKSSYDEGIVFSMKH